MDEFNYFPEIAWQIDIFGLTTTSARLFGDMGMKANFMNRIDVQDRSRTRIMRELEVVWRPYYEYSGKDSELFGHVFWHHYSPPECFKNKNHQDLITSRNLTTEEEWNDFIDEFHKYIVNLYLLIFIGNISRYSHF